MPGAISESRFDNWYAGFTDWAHVFRNEISFFTETALYDYATPHFYTVRDFPKNYQDLRALSMYTTPWEGGWWRLKDAVDYMVGGSMSVLDLAAKNRETLLYNRYQAARDNIEHFSKEPPFAYVISDKQADTPEAGLLAQKMIDNGLDVYASKSGFKANGVTYPAGSWVIPMDQPFSALAKELFERQKYPDALENGTSKAIDLPYDVTGWTLPLQMGVNVDAVTDPLAAGRARDADKDRQGGVAGSIDRRHGHGVRRQPQGQCVVRAGECGAAGGRNRLAGTGAGEDRRRHGDGRVSDRRQSAAHRLATSRRSMRCRRWPSARRRIRLHSRRRASGSTGRGRRRSTRAGRAGFWRTTDSSRRAFTTPTCARPICAAATT